MQDSGELIGEVLLKLASSAALQGEIGYIFNPVYAGKGYAAEAVHSVLERGFTEVGFHRILPDLMQPIAVLSALSNVWACVKKHIYDRTIALMVNGVMN